MHDNHDNEVSLAQLTKLSNKLFFSAPKFVLGMANIDQIPRTDEVEVAVVGRSNVGKSSLINSLLNSKTMAKTSNTPGRTRQVNFFLLNSEAQDVNERLMLADLPGYGFAKAPKTEVETWTRLIFTYLRGRAQLRRVLLLVDSRHGIKDSDKQCMDILDQAAVNWQVVLTKTDKIKQPAVDKLLLNVEAFIKTRPAAYPIVAATSSEKNYGIEDLRLSISNLLIK